jgi:hypothetical protein
MASEDLIEIVERAERLTPSEQLELIARLATRLRHEWQAPDAHLRWRDLRGSVPYPMVGEDAQDWVSRTRRESDEGRDQPWNRSQ